MCWNQYQFNCSNFVSQKRVMYLEEENEEFKTTISEKVLKNQQLTGTCDGILSLTKYVVFFLSILASFSFNFVSADSLFLATISEYTVPISDEELIVWDSAPINPGENFNTGRVYCTCGWLLSVSISWHNLTIFLFLAAGNHFSKMCKRMHYKLQVTSFMLLGLTQSTFDSLFAGSLW